MTLAPETVTKQQSIVFNVLKIVHQQSLKDHSRDIIKILKDILKSLRHLLLNIEKSQHTKWRDTKEC